jgi:hypothetical protein
MGGTGSGRPANGIKAPKEDLSHLSKEEKLERSRKYARLRQEKAENSELNGYQLYKLNYKMKYHDDEKRIGHLREEGRVFKVDEDPAEFMIYIREKNRRILDEILNDVERMQYIFSDRDDITETQKNLQRQRNHYTAKEIKEMERKLNEEFNLLEDRKTQSTFKPINEE